MLRQLQAPTTHLLSIGGWDAPHPDTLVDGRVRPPLLLPWSAAGAAYGMSGHPAGLQTWWRVFQRWNEAVAAQPALGFHGFDGIDWDLEGNDNATCVGPSGSSGGGRV